MSADKYKEGDRVFAKMKGYPAWPALIKNRLPGKMESYLVFFYGTYESAKLKPDSIYPYNEETKARYGKAQRKPAAKFKEALEEIENNVIIEAVENKPPPAEPQDTQPPPLQATATVPAQSESVDDDEEGNLVIDEGPAPPVLEKEAPGPAPPLLKKETKTPTAPKKPVTKKVAKKVPLAPATSVGDAKVPDPEEHVQVPAPALVKPVVRRVSKGKRDSISNANPATPPESVAPVVPQPEVVSRSGRKIKPKRFADDDETPVNSKASPGQAAASESVPAKRVKRVSSVNAPTAKAQAVVAAPAPAAAPPKPEAKSVPPPPPLERPKLVAARNAKKKPAPTAASVSPAVVAPAPPKPAASRPPPPLRAMPGLIPAPSPTAPVLPDIEPKAEPEAMETSGTVEEIPHAAVDKAEVKDEEKPAEETQGIVKGNDEDLSNPETPDYEISKQEEQIETDEEGTEKENNAHDEEEAAMSSSMYENGVEEFDEEAAPSVPKRMKVDLKSGNASVILSFNHDRPSFRGDAAGSIEYDMATARSVLQTKTQLEVNETAFLKSVADGVIDPEEIKDEDNQKEVIRLRNRTLEIQQKVAQLRMEGEIMEIIGELVGCLSVKSANCDRALDLLERLGSRTDINTLALKKNPELVDVIRKVQNYHGNVDEWSLPQAKAEDFHVKAELIREKAASIYQGFKEIFCSGAKPFYATYVEEVRKFKEAVDGVPQEAVLAMFHDPTSSPNPAPDSPPDSGKEAEEDPVSTNGNAEIEDESAETMEGVENV